MITRTFQAPTLREAMRRVHETLGDEAVILGTREVRDARSEAPPRYEVTASGRAAASGAPAQRRRAEGRPGRSEETRRVERPRASPPPVPPPEPREAGDEGLRADVSALRREVEALRADAPRWEALDTHLRGAVDELRAEVARLARGLPRGGSGEEADPEVRGLVAAGVEPIIAEALVSQARVRVAPDHGLAVARPPDLAGEVREALDVGPAIWDAPAGTIAALVGPTGGGKTRTVAKLAALARFVHNRRVGIVTSDMQRIGGAETLRSFCDILGLPLRRARDRRELRAALRALEGRDLVLVDTPGCGPGDAEALAHQAELLGGSAVARHLVMPAATPAEDVRAAARRFAPTGVASVVVTKLDEARGPGAALSAPWGAAAPMSHVCAGQAVPDDCRAADAEDLTRRILARAA
ncbi:MAG: hypothetical protein ACQEXJ_21735 [Myxococcota bacterium]